MTFLSWSLKGESPYNDANNNTIARRLKPDGYTPLSGHPGKLGKRQGLRARCLRPDPLDSNKKVNVFTFVSTGENIWLVTLWTQG